MIYCCEHCFADSGLRDLILQLKSEKGVCPYCKTPNQDLVEAKKLGSVFELVCNIYVENKDGKNLIDWLIEDWNVFSIQRDTANCLLTEILDDGERGRLTLVPSQRCTTKRLDQWMKLKEELRNQNRFFPDSPFELDRLSRLIELLVETIDIGSGDWHRSRVQTGNSPFPPSEMGAPPKELSTHGRANPAGIPYLYLASSPETAIGEVRVHPGERVCVAEFRITEKLQVVDLRHPRQRISPFLLGDEDEVALMRGDIGLLERLGEELKTPVLPNSAAIDYTPTQYLCEYIKKCGYQGVIYSSSMGEGRNLALFYPDQAKAGTVKQYKIEGIDVRSSEVQLL